MTLKKVLIVGVIVVVVALVATRAAICPINIGSEAISPTLKKGDTILVNRAARLMQQPLKHFDVVAIAPPYIDGNPYTPPDTIETTIADYTGLPVGSPTMMDVRRVIALPGETVVVRKDLGIFIDGKLLDESSYLTHQLQSDLFVLDDITKHSLDLGSAQPYQNSESPIVVPQNSLFVLPDNRLDFVGSDMWGFIPQDRVIGKVEFKVSNGGIAELKTPTLHFATEKVAMNDDGVRALNKGEFTKAIQLFKSALAIDNNFELARDNLSIAYNNHAIQSIKTPELALDSLHKALFLDPDNQLTKKNLAGVIARIGKSATRYEDRIALADEALKRGKAISALVEYREAVKLNPNPTILARVSSLEAQCNFPAHAIPEDQVRQKTLAQRPSQPNERPDEKVATKVSPGSAATQPRGPQASEALPLATNSKKDEGGTHQKEIKKEVAQKPAVGEPEPKEKTDGKAIAQKPPSSNTHTLDSKKAVDKTPSKTASNPISMAGALASLKADLDGKKTKASAKAAQQVEEEKQKSSYDRHNEGEQKGEENLALSSKTEDGSTSKVDKSKVAKQSSKEHNKSSPPIDDLERKDPLPQKIASITAEGASVKHGSATKSKSKVDDTREESAKAKVTAEAASKPTEKASYDDTKSDTREEPAKAKVTIEAVSKLTEKARSDANKSEQKPFEDSTGKAQHNEKVAKVRHEVIEDKSLNKKPRTDKHSSLLSLKSLKSAEDVSEIAKDGAHARAMEEVKVTPLKPNPLKRKSDGFDLGMMMEKMFSGMTTNSGDASTGTYRGPPLLKKQNEQQQQGF